MITNSNVLTVNLQVEDMFTDKDLALRVQQDILNICLLLEVSAYGTVKLSACSEDEYDEFMLSIQSVLSRLQSELLNKISAAHPDMKLPERTLPKQERQPRQQVPLNPEFKHSVPEPPLSDRSL